MKSVIQSISTSLLPNSANSLFYVVFRCSRSASRSGRTCASSGMGRASSISCPACATWLRARAAPVYWASTFPRSSACDVPASSSPGTTCVLCTWESGNCTRTSWCKWRLWLELCPQVLKWTYCQDYEYFVHWMMLWLTVLLWSSIRDNQSFILQIL